MQLNLYKLFLDAAPKERHSTTFIEAEGRRDITYQELSYYVALFHHLLLSEGLERGERVIACHGKHLEGVIFYLACLKGGFVYTPLNPDFTAPELAYFLEDLKPSLVLVDELRTGKIPPTLKSHASAPKLLQLETLQAAMRQNHAIPADFLEVCAPSEAETPAAIIYTSGTTGRPKGAVLSHGNLASNAVVLKDIWGMTADDCLLHALPLFHVHGLFVALHSLLLAGGRCLFLTRFTTDAVLAAFSETTVMMGVPTHYARLLQDPRLTREAAAGLRLFISGSAPLPEALWREFYARTGQKILERYGLSEVGMLTSNPLAGTRKPGSVGLPLPGVHLRLATEGGEAGLVQVRGPNVFQGYWQSPEKTRRAFTEDGYFSTGDLGRLDEEGYLFLLGRATELIISGGMNVYPREVEQALASLPGVIDCAVFGLPHPDYGEAVTAAIESNSSLDEEALLALLRPQLAGYKLPKRILRLDVLPKNAMGKLQKNSLRSRYEKLYSQAGKGH